MAEDAAAAGVQHAIANSKGFLVLDMLARRIGHAKMFAALAEFQRLHAGQESGWEDLQAHLERRAGEDLGWFFEQWLGRTGAPKYDLDWSQRGRTLRVHVAQDSPTYRTRLEVEARHRNGARVRHELEIVDAEAEASFEVPFRATSVTLDPDGIVLRRPGRNAPTAVLAPDVRSSCPAPQDRRER
jgi:aminopeptidase N